MSYSSGTASWVRASAPGKLMLLGEHAVLRGQPALVCAIDRRLRLRARRRADGRVVVRSDLGELDLPLPDLRPEPPFAFLATVVRRFTGRLDGGVELVVESDFSDEVGFGSSSAVTVCAVAALSALSGENADQDFVFREALEVVRSVQQRASGADVAASVYGGTLLYSAEEGVLGRSARDFPLVAVYSGSKMPTPEVIRRVEGRIAGRERIFDPIFEAMGASSTAAFEALSAGNYAEVGEILRINQGLMDALGVSNRALWEIVQRLQAEPGILGTKISGSGLGDCVVALGEIPGGVSLGYPIFRLRPSNQGVLLD